MARVLAAATAPPTPAELAGEEAAMAAFWAARAAPAPPPVWWKRWRAALAVKIAVAAVVLLGGVAFAAGTGALPNPLRLGEDPPTPNPTPSAGPKRGSVAPSTEGSGHAPLTSEDPAVAGLCRAYQASQGRVGHELDRAVLAELASLAGGVEEVPEFCALLLGELDKGNDPGRGSPPVEASRGPSESRGPGVAGEEAP